MRSLNRSEHGHGGEVFTASKHLGIPVRNLIDFSASINPLGISKKAERAMRAAIALLPNYPDAFSSDFSSGISHELNLSPDSIVPGNGSTELIYLVPRALKPRTVLIHEPTFSEYERASILAGSRIKNITGIPFGFDTFIHSLKSADMAFLCNPNNPTGELLSKESVTEIARQAKRNRCYLVLDEAFIDFCPECSIIGQVKENPYLIVLRSMTKFYALTGIRAGYAVAAPLTAKKIFAHKEPWTINILAGISSLASLEDKTHAAKTRALIKKEKAHIEEKLRRLGIWSFNSGANFYLIKMKKARLFNERILRKGILVRDCSNFKGLGKDHLRFAVKTRKENDILLNEIKTWLSEI